MTVDRARPKDQPLMSQPHHPAQDPPALDPTGLAALSDQQIAELIARGRNPLAEALAGWHTPTTELDDRRYLSDRLAWGVPDEPVLAALLALGPLVEMGAGTGYWAAMLRARAADLIAYEPAIPDAERNAFHRLGAHWSELMAGGAEMAATHPERTLLLIWPPHRRPMAARALRNYAGEQLAYIGEPAGGKHGEEEFWARLTRDWQLVARLDTLHRWPGVQDALHVFRRRRSEQLARMEVPSGDLRLGQLTVEATEVSPPTSAIEFDDRSADDLLAELVDQLAHSQQLDLLLTVQQAWPAQLDGLLAGIRAHDWDLAITCRGSLLPSPDQLARLAQAGAHEIELTDPLALDGAALVALLREAAGLGIELRWREAFGAAWLDQVPNLLHLSSPTYREDLLAEGFEVERRRDLVTDWRADHPDSSLVQRASADGLAIIEHRTRRPPGKLDLSGKQAQAYTILAEPLGRAELGQRLVAAGVVVEPSVLDGWLADWLAAGLVFHDGRRLTALATPERAAPPEADLVWLRGEGCLVILDWRDPEQPLRHLLDGAYAEVFLAVADGGQPTSGQAEVARELLAHGFLTRNSHGTLRVAPSRWRRVTAGYAVGVKLDKTALFSPSCGVSGAPSTSP